MVFHWSLSDSKFPQVSRTLLSILAVLNNVVAWMVSTRPPTFMSSNLFYNPLVTVPKAPITIGITVTFLFHSFFNSLARSRFLSFISHFFSLILWSAETAKSTNLQILFVFLLIIIRSGLPAAIRWSVCMSKFQRSLCVPFSRTGAGWCSDSKSLRVSRTLTDILADLNNAMVWMVSILPLISNCSDTVFNSLGHFFKCTNYNIYHQTLTCSISFLLRQGLSICISFHFIFTPLSARTVKSTG